MSTVSVGDRFRDKYPGYDLRTIRVIRVLPNGVWAQVETDTRGIPPNPPRTTTIKFSTLRAGYVKIEDGKQ